MAAHDPYQPLGNQPEQAGVPQAQPIVQSAQFANAPLNHPLPGQPVQPQPYQGQPIQGQPIQGQPIQGQPIQGQPIQGQPIQGQPIQGQPIQGQPIQGQPYQGQPYQGQPYQQPAQPGQTYQQMGVAGQQPIANRGAQPVAVAPSGSTTVRQHDEEEEEETDVAEVAIKAAPPWLVSAVFHMALLIILGLWMLAATKDNQISLDMETIYAEELGEQLEFDSPLGLDNIDVAEEPIITPDDLPQVEDPFAAPPTLDIQPEGTTSTSDIDSRIAGLALKGREEGSKKSLLGKYGGNATTEAAVLLGLQWLARNQKKDGSWSLAGPYRGGISADIDNPVAATAMALLAFQGHGDTHKKGKFRQNVTLGWKWLLQEQDANGNFYHEGPIHHRFYTQGQCTIAACELFGMTKDETYRKPAELAVKYCLDSQSSLGGWRYMPNGDSDVSVTGWIVMALQSAKMAGLEVPEDHFRRVERFLDKLAQQDGARYPYRRGEDIKLSMTAEAMLMRQYLGWPRDHPAMIDALEWITSKDNLINFKRNRDVYYWYYATQAAHHMEGEYWKRWNAVMRQAVPEAQTKSGRETGSWDPMRPSMDQWGPQAGRLYVTCLSIYMLEVYYRHLPIYTNVYTDLLKSGRNPLSVPEPK